MGLTGFRKQENRISLPDEYQLLRKIIYCGVSIDWNFVTVLLDENPVCLVNADFSVGVF
jgi:hypothetical protein